MRIAVTGAQGRVGRYVTAAALVRGHEIVAIDRVSDPSPAPSGQRNIVAEATDYDALSAAFDGCGALIHLAGIPHPFANPDHVVHNNNVTASYTALRAAIEIGIKRLCQASSVNATGLSFSHTPRFDYFPIDELHPTYNDEPYGLSKWICEAQAASLTRRYTDIRIASLRFHLVIPSRDTARADLAETSPQRAKELFGYTRGDAAADACLKSLTADFTGHEVFNIAAPDTLLDEPTRKIARRLHPDVEIRRPLLGNASFFDSTKAERLLGWIHPPG